MRRQLDVLEYFAHSAKSTSLNNKAGKIARIAACHLNAT
jgi:hypothetical protein